MKIRNEVKIALVAIVGIVLLFFGLQYLKGQSLFSTDNHYYVKFKDITGMTPASPIYANGYKVGVVNTIDYDYNNPENVVAVISIDSRLKLPKGTKAEIASDLLGNVQLVLQFGPNPLDQVNAGDTIQGGIQVGMKDKLSTMVPQIEQLLPKLDSILVSVNALLSDPALANALHNVDHITSHLDATTQELSQLSASLNHQVPQMLTKADNVLANTENITRKLNAVDLEATMRKVDNTLANVEQMTKALNSKDGTLGLLMHDPELYQNLNATMRNADQLMIDLKAHPKRYVHFSVFGKKDK